MKPTQEQIDAEVALLRAMKPTVIKHSAFGDNHHDAIDAAIAVLEEELSPDDIYDRFEPSGNEDLDADEGKTQHSLDAANEASYWMEGESDDAPSENWKSLVRE